jgi:Flp pilus assembly protein TadG
MRRLRPIRDQRGVALVEFTLVLPLLLLLLLGMVEFGRAINYWIDATHLANEAARFASVNRNPSADLTLQEYIRSQATTEELRDGDDTDPSGVPTTGRARVCISFPDADDPEAENPDPGVGDPVRATVTATFNWLPFLADALDGVTSTEIVGRATMRLEAQPDAELAGCSA